jgi:hypothetical protein
LEDYGAHQGTQKIGGRSGVKNCALGLIRNVNAFGTGDAAKWVLLLGSEHGPSRASHNGVEQKAQQK